MNPKRDSTLLPIAIAVIAAHACAIAASFFMTPTMPPLLPQPKLLVKTIHLSPTTPVTVPRQQQEIAVAEPASLEEVQMELEPVPPAPSKLPEPLKPEPPIPTPAKEPEPEISKPEPKKVDSPSSPPTVAEAELEPPTPVQAPTLTPVVKSKPKPKKIEKKPEKKPVSQPKQQALPKKEPPKKPGVPKKQPVINPPKKSEPPVAKKIPDKKSSDSNRSSAIVAESKPAPNPIPPGPPKPTAEEIAAQKRQQALITQAKENIAKIGKSRDKGSLVASSGLPEGPAIYRLESLQIDALPTDNGVKFTPQESSYRDELASRLKLLLSLPEYGEVKIKLTLDRAGKVKKVEVVKAENSSNRKYVEKTLPTLKFPPFGNYFGEAESYTFLISLRNE